MDHQGSSTHWPFLHQTTLDMAVNLSPQWCHPLSFPFALSSVSETLQSMELWFVLPSLPKPAAFTGSCLPMAFSPSSVFCHLIHKGWPVHPCGRDIIKDAITPQQCVFPRGITADKYLFSTGALRGEWGVLFIKVGLDQGQLTFVLHEGRRDLHCNYFSGSCDKFCPAAIGQHLAIGLCHIPPAFCLKASLIPHYGTPKKICSVFGNV